MALMLHPSSFTTTLKKPHLLHHTPPPPPPYLKTIKSQQDSSSEQPPAGPPAQKPSTSSSSPSSSSGLGFGSSSATSTKKKRASIIRREPVEKPVFASPQQEARAEEARKNESAFLLAWLGLGAIILAEGIILAASGFLPEKWDAFFVKYLYPAFTPTVFLFVAGTVAYGVLKYLQNEKFNSED